MALNVTIKGLDELRANLKQFSDRRFNAAIATAATRTALTTRQDLKAEMGKVFDRPTAYALNGMYVKTATADKPTSRVWFKDDGSTSNAGTPAEKFILPNVEGGARRTKRFERALQAAGALPQGWHAVPGQGARLDAYGNIAVGQIIQILSQLRITLVAGSTRNLSTDARKKAAALKKAGGRFFVVPPGVGIQPGVYQREFIGRTITPVLVFVQSTNYKRRFDFFGVGRASVERTFPAELSRSVQDHINKLASRK